MILGGLTGKGGCLDARALRHSAWGRREGDRQRSSSEVVDGRAGEGRHKGVWLPRGVRVRALGLPFIYRIICLMPASLTGL